MAVILVVDDTHVDRQIAKLVLEAHGHTVHEAPTREDALQCLRGQAVVFRMQGKPPGSLPRGR